VLRCLEQLSSSINNFLSKSTGSVSSRQGRLPRTDCRHLHLNMRRLSATAVIPRQYRRQTKYEVFRRRRFGRMRMVHHVTKRSLHLSQRGTSRNIIPSVYSVHDHTPRLHPQLPAGVADISLTSVLLLGVELAFLNIKLTPSTARRCQTISANGKPRLYRCHQAALYPKYDCNALKPCNLYSTNKHLPTCRTRSQKL
jgi:hypothetical protein